MSPQERFAADFPPVSVPYVKKHAPQALEVAERYNEARQVAANHADLDALQTLKDKIVAATS